MDATDLRPVVSQLAEDLSWLENHSRQQPELARHTGHLRLAAGLVRNVLGPYVDGQPPVPLHIAVVGGAGAGKSTIVNFLTGSKVAEANPQAGYTRHPTAYFSGTTQWPWPSHAGFLGPLQRLTTPAPANLDEDVYQVRRVAGPSTAPNSKDGGFGPLEDCIVWDCPDMTTWAATGYVPRLMEVASAADVVVYVASDERYNDEVPTQFLHLLVQAGKPVVVCLTKMREEIAPQLVAHFETEVLGRLPKTASGKPTVPVVAVPYMSKEQLDDPIAKSGKYRIPLLNQILVLTEPAEQARRRTVDHSLQFLTTAGEGLLEVARQDLAALDGWKNLVQTGRNEFTVRYRREFLNGERFRRFDEAREHVMNLIELPGAGRAVSTVLHIARWPYRLLRGFISEAFVGAETLNLPEQQVLEGSMRAWLDLLRAEALRRADTHLLWRHIVNGFSSGFGEQADKTFHDDLRRFQMNSADEIEAVCRNMTVGLEQNSGLLASLRIANVLLDVAAVGLGFWAGGLSWWTLAYIPLFASVAHQIVELGIWQYVEQKRSASRVSKENLVIQTIADPMSKWLIEWPATGGSAYERLQATLRRVPEAIQSLGGRVREMLAAANRPAPVNPS